MRTIWTISDTHFFHENILKFERGGKLIRPGFANIAEMNELIADNWADTVKDGDIVYHLGDVFLGHKPEFEILWKSLPGRKRLIVGNHDDIKYLARGNFFQKINMWRMLPELGVLLSHVPLHPEHIRDDLINVHGHIHQNDSPAGNYINVCVEKTNYNLINLEEISLDKKL